MQVEDRITSSPPPPSGAADTPLLLRPRLWPVLVLVAAYWGFFFGSYAYELANSTRFFARLITSGLLILLFLGWWSFNRRIPGRQRLLGLGVFVAAGLAATALCHPSIAGFTQWGVFGLILGPVPFVLSVWVVALLLTRRATKAAAMVGTLAAVVFAWGFLTSIRASEDGLWGDLWPSYEWRWTRTREEQRVQKREQNKASQTTSAPVKEVVALQSGDWSGFRGPDREGAVRGTKIRTDWSTPPKLVWKHEVGPGWSSVVVAGKRLFTQEQLENREAIIAYDAATGDELWAHEVEGRFAEPAAGAGPRATPCLAGNRLFALGATGTLFCLDPSTGHLHWSKDIKQVSGAKLPMWGFSGSPLVVGDHVIVYAGGDSDKGILAFDAQTGELAWSAPSGKMSYSSPHPAKLGGKLQALMFSDEGLISVDPGTGTVLWKQEFDPKQQAPYSIQPHVLNDHQILVGAEGDFALKLIDVKHEGGSWSSALKWSKRTLKPSFNDFVIHDGIIYGFDDSTFCCVEASTGKKLWRKGQFGKGQVLLLLDQGLLLIVSEKGAVVLARANPKDLEVLGSFQAIDGKTWNHPVVAHGRLYVRNGSWMACYDLQ